LPSSRRVLSALTIAFLACQVWTIVALERNTWPVIKASMFSAGADRDEDVELTGTMRDGRIISMTPIGLGLREHQLHHWLANTIGPRIDETDLPVLARVAKSWNARNPDTRVVAVKLWLKRLPLPAGSAPSTTRGLLWWRAS
jgi:hypothetical protein